MAEYPTEFEFEAILNDGRTVRLRPIRPGDVELERAFIGRVGPISSYFRFFQFKTGLSSDELSYFTTIDYLDRMALIAIDGQNMVAVARYDVLPVRGNDPKVAEIAFLVQDDYQRRGIGSLLLHHLTVHARLNGITGFRAYVLAENRAMLRLFSNWDYKLSRHLEEGTYRVVLPIEAADQGRSDDATSDPQRRPGPDEPTGIDGASPTP